MPSVEAPTGHEASLAHHHVQVAPGVRLHYVEQGSGPLVVLLHGFPDFWYGWRRQIGALARAGFRVVVPDQRGYNLSDKPPGIEPYAVGHLVNDVAQLIRACGETRASVVGHDWGGGVAWALAMERPELVTRLVILNCPHPERLFSGLRRPSQLMRSWYMFFFQLPRLPEAVARAGRHAALLTALRESPSGFDDADLARYRQAYAQPGALTSMINWYRAAFRVGRPSIRRIDAPVLVLWGERDRYLGRDLAAPEPSLVPRAEVELVSAATHWVQLDAWALVNERLVEFLRRPASMPERTGREHVEVSC